MSIDMAQLAHAADSDAVMREALAQIQWLGSRPFEGFASWWTARLNDPTSVNLTRELRSKAASGDAFAEQAEAEIRRLVLRTHEELKVIAWHKGWMEGNAAGEPIDDPLGRAKANYQLGDQQHAYFLGWFEGQRAKLLRVTGKTLAVKLAELEKTGREIDPVTDESNLRAPA